MRVHALLLSTRIAVVVVLPSGLSANHYRAEAGADGVEVVLGFAPSLKRYQWCSPVGLYVTRSVVFRIRRADSALID